MGTEVELKLALPPSMLRQAAQAPWLQKAAAGRATRSRMISIYFDTPDFALRDHGVTLRVRKTDTEQLQTIKASGTDLVRRSEWEDEIDDDRPQLSLAKHTALAPILTGRIKKELRPIFETSVERLILPLRVGKSEIELAFDRGRIVTPDDSDVISEIEIELKSGHRSDMAAIARRLAKAFPVAYAARTKSERGYALLEGTLHSAVSARPVQLSPDMTTAEAFTTIGLECLRHAAANEDAVGHRDREGVHQMRVGLRRLRAALSLFKDMLEGRDTSNIKAGLVWVTEQLGPARDHDVFVAESVAPLLKRHPERPELRLLQHNFQKERDRAFAHAKEAVAGAHYRHTILDTALWLLDGEWRANPDALAEALRERPLPEFVRDELKQRSRKIAKKVGKIDSLSPRRRHKLRISVKKMRYACEFFRVPIVRQTGTKAARRFDRALKQLQSRLGKLNDIAVHAQLAGNFTRPGQATQEAFAIGYVVGQEQAASGQLLRDATRAGKQMKKKAAIF
jgi:inorganic triphosphatase YgiF